MNIQRPVFVVIAAAILMFAPALAPAAEEVQSRATTADEAVIAVEVSADGDAEATVVVEVQTTVAGQAVFVQTRGRGFGAYNVREVVDPEDAVERFAILLPGGPLIVEATMTIDGEPFRAPREALIDGMLADGDVDGDGVIAWDEALGSPRFTFGRVIQAQQRSRYLETLDLDEDGEVDRSEARGFLAMYFQGPSFNVMGGGFAGRGRGGAVISVNGQMLGAGGAEANVRALLDTDNDGLLSESEIAEAGERLKSRDADDNDLLYAAEIGGSATSGAGRLAVNANGNLQLQGQPQQAILLGPTTQAEALFDVIRNSYQTENGVVGPNSFSAVSSLFNELDVDGDESLSQSEMLGLNDVAPHVKLTVNVGGDGRQSSLTLTELFGERTNADNAERAATVEWPGASVAFTASNGQPQTANFEMAAQRMLAQYDNDNNGYLERSELPENVAATQFDNWDVDQDSKVFREEIADSYARAQAPQQSQVQAHISQSGDPLFPALDLSGDSRLSLREMQTAAVQLSALDKDGDGRLTQTEVPTTYAVTFGIGNGGYAYGRFVTAAGGFAQTGAAAPTDGPEWFVRMDRNGDGDVTLREFLGGREAFMALDTNSDGFIEPAEAEAASGNETDED